MSDIDAMVDYVRGFYFEETAQKYREIILYNLESLSFSAGSFAPSRYQTARRIHPEARTLSIMNHRWTVVFHVEGEYVIVDRILPSSMMVD